MFCVPVFAKKTCFLHMFFFMDVNANFVGELLGNSNSKNSTTKKMNYFIYFTEIQTVLQDSYSLEFRNGSASLLIHFPPISLH